MEAVIFVTTSLVIYICVFAILAKTDEHKKNAEIDFFKDVQRRFCLIQDYINNLEKVLREKEEHIMRCILHSTVRVCHPIRGIKIESYVTLQFEDIRVIDVKNETVPFTINRKTKQSWGYRVCSGSSFEEDKKELLVEFETSVIFKYIDFLDLKNYEQELKIILLTEGEDAVVFINAQKHMICNAIL